MDRSNGKQRGLSPERLVEVADLVIEAIGEVERTSGTICPYPPDLVGRADQPSSLNGVTRAEAEEATQFLIRLGVIELPRAV